VHAQPVPPAGCMAPVPFRPHNGHLQHAAHASGAPPPRDRDRVAALGAL
jgi:hypothetical protein